MEKVINLRMPHIGEQVFENFETQKLIECALVSDAWKVLAERILLKRWTGKLFEVCASGNVEIPSRG